jgi:hypothetical protein
MLVVLVVLGSHALLLLLWWSELASVGRWLPPAAQQAPLLVRNVSIAPAVQATPPKAEVLAPPNASTTASTTVAPKDKKPVQRAAAFATPTATPSSLAITAPDAATASTAEPAASQPVAPLDLALPRATDATAMRGRGALTAAQGSTRQLALNDPRANEQVDPTKKLPDAVAAAAKGDCLKGEFFGGGMGLLSAPFLAAAAATGHCKPQR